MIKASVYIICKNEEKHIQRVLESVKDFDEIIVVDSGSVDNTLEIARKYTNKVFYQESKVSPRREQTRSLYMEVEAESELQGRIIARELVEKKYPQYNIEFIELLSEKHLQYEKEHADFSITEF